MTCCRSFYRSLYKTPSRYLYLPWLLVVPGFHFAGIPYTSAFLLVNKAEHLNIQHVRLKRYHSIDMQNELLFKLNTMSTSLNQVNVLEAKSSFREEKFFRQSVKKTFYIYSFILDQMCTKSILMRFIRFVTRHQKCNGSCACQPFQLSLFRLSVHMYMMAQCDRDCATS